MTCHNQLELGEKKLRSSEADDPIHEGPHSVGVWTLKTIDHDLHCYHFYVNNASKFIVPEHN